MFCGNCGTEIKNGSQFCHVCGTPVGNSGNDLNPFAGVSGNPGRSGGSGRSSHRKPSGKKPPKLLIAIAAAVAVLALVITLFLGVFSGPSGKVVKALAKSGQAFSSAIKDTKLTNAGELITNKKNSQAVSFWVENADGASELEGIGVRLTADTDLSGRKIGMNVTPFFGSADLVSLQVKLDDDSIYVGSPELTENTFYMINTATIGDDLQLLTGEDELAGLSINLFDLVEELEKLNGGNEKAKKAAEKAFKEFVKEIEVEKDGTETIEVNDQDLKCTAYHVTVTEDSMDALLDALEDAYGSVDNTDAYLDLLESMGMPDEALDEVRDSLEASEEELKYSLESLHEAVGELGDVELDLYLNKGYVVAAVYEGTIDDYDVEMILNIGGGKEYVDDISLRIIADDEELSIVSSGNHTGAGGEFTDNTVIEMDEGGYNYTIAEMELFYAPKDKENNFAFSLTADGDTLATTGRISCDSNSLLIRLDEIMVDSTVALGFEYQIGKYEGDNINVKNSVNLTKMTDAELTAEAEKLTRNAEALVQTLMNDYPDLMYYLY